MQNLVSVISMNNYLSFIVLATYLGLIATGTAQEFSYAFSQDQGQEIEYLDSYYPAYYPSAYWSYPYVPAKIAVQATKERLWANKYNPNSVFWQVQGTKERLWAVKNACYGCWQDYGWMERGSLWKDRY
jgi:hypothetical protein